MKTLTRITLAAATLLLTGTGCGDDEPVAAAKKPAAAVKPAPVVAPVSDGIAIASVPYTYSRNDLRDPFRAPDMDARQAVVEASSCREPLCAFGLEQLSLVAVVTGGPNPLAMVEDPQGRGFNVRRNSRVGNKEGRVTAIRRDEITITEFWTGPDGKKNPSHVSLKLRPDNQVTPVVDLVTGAEYR